jgi:hypothetical protein
MIRYQMSTHIKPQTLLMNKSSSPPPPNKKPHEFKVTTFNIFIINVQQHQLNNHSSLTSSIPHQLFFRNSFLKIYVHSFLKRSLQKEYISGLMAQFNKYERKIT